MSPSATFDQLGVYICPETYMEFKTENDLIKGCSKGTRSAQQQLYVIYYEKMLAVARVYASNQEEAQDIVMDGFLKIFSRIHNFRKESTLETWMNRIMTNTAIDAIRKKLKDKSWLNSESTQEIADDVEDQEADFFEKIDISNEEILTFIQKLPDGYRLVFTMYAIDEMPHKQIAEALGITESTSKTQYIRAKRTLKKLIVSDQLRKKQYDI